MLEVDESEFEFQGLYATSNFSSFFQFQTADGNISQALTNENGLLITKEMAMKVFGNEDVIGEVVTIRNTGDFAIAGIIDTDQYKTHLLFDVIIPIRSFTKQAKNQPLLTDWEEGSKTFYNYFKLKEGASRNDLDTYLSNLDINLPDEKKVNYKFETQRLDNINLGRLIRNEIGTTTPVFVAYFFGVLAIVLILSASFNYMNMAIARGLKRAREVGVRKSPWSWKKSGSGHSS